MAAVEVSHPVAAPVHGRGKATRFSTRGGRRKGSRSPSPEETVPADSCEATMGAEQEGIQHGDHTETQLSEEERRAVAPLRVAPFGDPFHKKSAVGQILQLLQGIKVGSDISKLAVPPTFNTPKSQLQMFAESLVCIDQDLLGACTAGQTPMERMLAVVRWHLSTTRGAAFGKAPYNPVLGETHHISAGGLNVLLEQVSHHPPVSALRGVYPNKKIVTTWWHQPTPRFYGSWMEADIKGRRVVELGEHGETYELCSPRLSFRFLPNPGSEWVGWTYIKCKETGLEAWVEFKAKAFFGLRGENNRVWGKVVNQDKKELVHLWGAWDKKVTMKDLETGTESLLYDHDLALGDHLTPVVEEPERLRTTESILVWRHLTNALLEENWDDARKEKALVETEQREIRKQREDAGEEWSPQFFKLVGDNWEWKDAEQVVLKAPIVSRDPKTCAALAQ